MKPTLADNIREAFKKIDPPNGIIYKYALLLWLVKHSGKRVTPQTFAAYSALVSKLSWSDKKVIHQSCTDHGVYVSILK